MNIIILEDIDPVVFGINNNNVQLLKTLYPKINIVARGNVIKASGDEGMMADLRRKFGVREVQRRYQCAKEEDIIEIVKGKTPEIAKQQNLIIWIKWEAYFSADQKPAEAGR